MIKGGASSFEHDTRSCRSAAVCVTKAPMNFARSYRFWFYFHPKPSAEGLDTA
jgi:hypothetical protein